MTAVALALTTLGQFVQVVSIIWYQGRHGKAFLYERIAREIHYDSWWDTALPSVYKYSLCRAYRNEIFEPFLVWMQSYGSPKELREWIRTKRRYRYVGENWLMAMDLGIFVAALILGAHWLWLLGMPPLPDLQMAMKFIFSIFIYWVCRCGLIRLQKHNDEQEDVMISVYLSGHFSPALQKKFLRGQDRQGSYVNS